MSNSTMRMGIVLCGLTFELSWHRRWDARPGLAKMYRVPPARAWWPAVGAQLERGVRPHSGANGWLHGAHAATAEPAARRRNTRSCGTPQVLGTRPIPCIAPCALRSMTTGCARVCISGALGRQAPLPANANGRERCRRWTAFLKATELDFTFADHTRCLATEPSGRTLDGDM